MTAELLAAISGIVLSICFSYIPGLSKWFGELTDEYKRLLMLGLLAVVAGAAFGLACAGFAADLGITIPCDKSGAVELVKAFIAAAVANQAAYKLSPYSQSRKAANALYYE